MGRYFLRSTTPIYGWWFYYMWSNVIGPELKTLHPKLNVRTEQDVDELLACEVRVSVSAYLAYYTYFAYILIILTSAAF